MAKGGKRIGAGRPKGRKDLGLRNVKKQLPTAKNNPTPNLPAKATYLQMEKYLSTESRKLYRSLATKFESPSDCLKAIRDDLMARYNLGRIGEIEENAYVKKTAKEGIKEIEETGMYQGKTLTETEKIDKLTTFRRQANSYPQLSSKLTSLAGEIRQVNELIDRIESGRPDKVINLFNILDGRVDKNKTERLREEVFNLPEEAEETKQNQDKEVGSVEDADIVNEDNDKEQDNIDDNKDN